MTDNEIIKALECCTSDKCLECPLKNIPKVSGCMALMTSALKLINRQKAEIDRYKNAYDQIKWERDMFEEDLQTAKAEIEFLKQDALTPLVTKIGEAVERDEKIKTEAIKEIAKKIEDTTWYSINSEGELVVGANGKSDVPLYKADDILEIVKEMVGDNDESKI